MQLSGKKKDYLHFGQYKMPLLYAALLQDWARPQNNQSRPLTKVSGQTLILDGHLFWTTHDWKVIDRDARKALEEKNSQYFEDFFLVASNITQSLAEFLSNQQIESATNQLQELFRLVHELEYPWIYGIALAEAVEKFLRPNFSNTDLQIFFSSDRLTPFVMYQKKLEKLSKLRKNSKEFKKQAELILKEFGWVGMMHFWGEPNSLKKILESIPEKAAVPAKTKAKKISTQYQWLLPITQKLTYYRQFCAEMCAMASLKLYKIFQEFSIDPDIALWLTPDELFKFLPDLGKVDKKIVNQRQMAFGLFNSVITGRQLEGAVNKFVEKVSNTDSLMGTVASKGFASGRVKILLIPKDSSKMHQGDILVAHETTPDLVPAMRKAGAIVTDIGGLTSHAAIVSRELNIPCIIGTKFGTRVFKDGDLVEVNANSGIVRKVL